MKNKKLPLLFPVMMLISASFYVLVDVMADKKAAGENWRLGFAIAGFVLVTSLGMFLLLKLKRK